MGSPVRDGSFWPRAILHADMDAFFAAIEALDDPGLRGRPVIVGHAGPRGVVSTASYEARRFGVHSAMPSVQAARLCPGAVWTPPRHDRYAEVGKRVREVFLRFTELVEPVSIDEAFLDVTGSQELFGPPRGIAARVKRDLVEETGLTASVGVAHCKLVAKIASDVQKPDGLTVVSPGGEAEFLRALPVGRMWGIGPRAEERLKGLRVLTMGDLAAAPEGALAEVFGRDRAETMRRRCLGIDDRPVEPGGERKSMSQERTFPRDVFDLSELEHRLLSFAEDVAAELRAQEMVARTVVLKLRTPDFRTVTRNATLEEPTDLTEEVFLAASEMLRTRVSWKKKGVRLLGLGVTNLAGREEGQMRLFPDASAEKRRRAARAVDEIRKKLGKDAITRGRLFEPEKDGGVSPK